MIRVLDVLYEALVWGSGFLGRCSFRVWHERARLLDRRNSPLDLDPIMAHWYPEPEA